MQSSTCPEAPTGDGAQVFSGVVLKRDDGTVFFDRSTNPRDEPVEVFFGDEATYLAKGETYQVTAAVAAGDSGAAVSNVTCEWTLDEAGAPVNTDRLELPDNGLVSLGLGAAIGLCLAFGLVFLLLALKALVTGGWRRLRVANARSNATA